jgi:hypothetical protein
VFGISREAASVIVSAIELQVFLKCTTYGRVASKVVRWLQARWQRFPDDTSGVRAFPTLTAHVGVPVAVPHVWVPHVHGYCSNQPQG